MITLATLEQATHQEVFDQVTHHLLTQMKKSQRFFVEDEVSLGESCAYRSKDGLKCAAGCLMSDEEYKYEMERRSWNRLITLQFVPTEKHSTLIGRLQCVHDMNQPETWSEKLQKIAQEMKLQFNPPNTNE